MSKKHFIELAHQHKAQHISIMNGITTYEVCKCGATRNVTEQNPRWHTCKLCTHPWGLAGECGPNGGAR